jgi:hypothetical protein
METVEIAKTGDWSIAVKPWPSYSEAVAWWEVRVKHKNAKGSYWLGWNGNRLAKNKSMASMQFKNPELFEEVYETLQAWSAKKPAKGDEDGRASGQY